MTPTEQLQARNQELEIQVAALQTQHNARSQECFEKQVTIETLARQVQQLLQAAQAKEVSNDQADKTGD